MPPVPEALADPIYTLPAGERAVLDAIVAGELPWTPAGELCGDCLASLVSADLVSIWHHPGEGRLATLTSRSARLLSVVLHEVGAAEEPRWVLPSAVPDWVKAPRERWQRPIPDWLGIASTDLGPAELAELSEEAERKLKGLAYEGKPHPDDPYLRDEDGNRMKIMGLDVRRERPKKKRDRKAGPKAAPSKPKAGANPARRSAKARKAERLERLMLAAEMAGKLRK